MNDPHPDSEARGWGRIHDEDEAAEVFDRQVRQPRLDIGRESVAIVGSREWPYPDLVAFYVNQLPDDARVISGGARGPDQAAERTARRRGLAVRTFEADWTSQGLSAGFQRNPRIVRAGDRLVAFWWRQSGGTGHSIGLAQGQGKPVEIWYAEPVPAGPWSEAPDTREFMVDVGLHLFTIYTREDGRWVPAGKWAR